MRNVEDAVKLSMKNREQITESVQCGCYFCLEVFDGSEVTEWLDHGQTALCPRCGVDSLIPNETDEAYLIAACERWFTG